jgi:hypothetical protein
MALHRQRADKKAILFDDNALLLRVNQETISSHASASISNLMLIKNDFEAAENACVEPTICVKKTARSKPIQEKVSNPLNAYACDMKNATDSICSAYQSFSTWINSVWARKTTSLLITQREASLAEIDCAVKKVSFVLDKFQAVKGKDNKPCSFTQRFIKHYELDTHLESLKKIQSDWTSLDF